MAGKLDMNAVTCDVDSPTFSDADIRGLLLQQESEVLITVVKLNEDK